MRTSHREARIRGSMTPHQPILWAAGMVYAYLSRIFRPFKRK